MRKNMISYSHKDEGRVFGYSVSLLYRFLRKVLAFMACRKNYKEDGPMYDLEPAFNQIDSQDSGKMARVLSLAVNLSRKSANER